MLQLYSLVLLLNFKAPRWIISGHHSYDKRQKCVGPWAFTESSPTVRIWEIIGTFTSKAPHILEPGHKAMLCTGTPCMQKGSCCYCYLHCTCVCVSQNPLYYRTPIMDFTKLRMQKGSCCYCYLHCACVCVSQNPLYYCTPIEPDSAIGGLKRWTRMLHWIVCCCYCYSYLYTSFFFSSLETFVLDIWSCGTIIQYKDGKQLSKFTPLNYWPKSPLSSPYPSLTALTIIFAVYKVPIQGMLLQIRYALTLLASICNFLLPSY